ncbi:hypothetical protein GCM10028785_28630 [Hydrogenophaga soli]
MGNVAPISAVGVSNNKNKNNATTNIFSPSKLTPTTRKSTGLRKPKIPTPTSAAANSSIALTGNLSAITPPRSPPPPSPSIKDEITTVTTDNSIPRYANNILCHAI